MKKRTERLALMGLLLGVMLIVGYFENLFPLPGREAGIRLGLSNAILIFAVYMLGTKETLVLMFAKVVLSGVLFSGMQSILYSLPGGLFSVIAMAYIGKIPGVSILGVSVAGAFFFNVGQGLIVFWQVPMLIMYLPFVFLVGIASGVLTGILARIVVTRMKNTPGGIFR